MKKWLALGGIYSIYLLVLILIDLAMECLYLEFISKEFAGSLAALTTILINWMPYWGVTLVKKVIGGG